MADEKVEEMPQDGLAAIQKIAEEIPSGVSLQGNLIKEEVRAVLVETISSNVKAFIEVFWTHADAERKIENLKNFKKIRPTESTLSENKVHSISNWDNYKHLQLRKKCLEENISNLKVQSSDIQSDLRKRTNVILQHSKDIKRYNNILSVPTD